MIEEITIKNVLSYKNEVTFSFEATDDTTFESSHVVTMPNGTRLLKLGIIYGPNAGGKSNLLYAIDNLLEFWLSDYKNLDIPTPFEPFLLDQETPSQPSEYSLKFWVNNVRYWYQLHATSKSVIYEKLSYYKTTQPIKIFERELKDDQSIITFNPTVQKISQEEQKIISLYCLPNKSLFAVRGNVNIKIEHVDVVRKWIHTQFMQMIRPTTNMMHYSQRKIQEDSNFKEYILDFLNLADFNISGLNDHLEKKQIPEPAKKIFLEDETIPIEIKNKLLSEGTINKHFLGFEHTVENSRGKEKYELSTEQQSDGTKRIMGIEAAIYEAINNDSFLLIDEIESSLHPDLIEYMIQEYLLKSNQSQLLITTHYPGFMNTIDNLIRKDNIWFVEKDKTGSTDLYSLVEFKGLNKISRIERAYRNGQFGALPKIKN